MASFVGIVATLYKVETIPRWPRNPPLRSRTSEFLRHAVPLFENAMSDTLEQLKSLLQHSEWEYVNSALHLLDAVIEHDPAALDYVAQQIHVLNGQSTLKCRADFPTEIKAYFVHWLALFRPSVVQGIAYLKLGALDEVPEGISALPALRTLDLRDCTNLTTSDFSHCRVLLFLNQDTIQLPQVQEVFLVSAVNSYTSAFYSPPTLNLLSVLHRFPRLRKLEAPSALASNFPTPQTLPEHPIESLNSFDTEWTVTTENTSTPWFERITTATLPEEAIDSFLPLCSNLSELTIMSFNRLSHHSQTRTLPLSDCPNLSTIQLCSGTKADLKINLNLHCFPRPVSAAKWQGLLETWQCHTNAYDRAQELAREQQRIFADRWVAGDPSTHDWINDHYEPLMSDESPLTSNEKRWLSHFAIGDNEVYWHVDLVTSFFQSTSVCYRIREQALLDTIPEEQLCAFSCDNGAPVFLLNLGKNFPQIARVRTSYVEKHFQRRIADKSFAHFSLKRKNVPAGCLPKDAGSVVLNAASFTLETLRRLQNLPSLKKLSLNGAVTNSAADQEVLKQYCLALPHLTHLDICACGLTSLPPEISVLTQLEDLFLWGNQLSGLPAGMSKLVHLKRLSLSNSTTPIPDWVWTSSIEKLYHKRYILSSEERQHWLTSNIKLKR